MFYFWEDYKNTKVKVGANWVSECRYLENEGALEIRLDDRVIEMLTIFDRNNPFTKYERQMIVNLGTYGIILFELIASCMHQQHKQKSLYHRVPTRKKFNCVATYPEFSILNAMSLIEPLQISINIPLFVLNTPKIKKGE